jgi:hypothetical protein
MKYNLFKITAVLLMGVSLVSCKKYLDINKNPNNATEVDPKLLFSFATTTLVNNRAGGDLFMPMALAGQSQAGGGSSTDGVSWGSGAEDQYVFSPFSFANIWTQFYTSVGINLKQAIVLSESSTPVNNNAAAQSKVVLAETFYELTTIYGDVPFSEALREDISAPKFDAQKDVLEGCLTMLDEAIAQFEPGSELKITSYDMFYGGDIDKWIQVAKAMKLRILMTMVDQDDSKKSAIGDLITADEMLQSADDNFQISFQNIAGKRSPKYQIDADYLANVDFFYASSYVLDPMKDDADPRIPFFFQNAATWRPKLDLPGGATTYNGILPGEDADDEVASKISSDLHSPTQADVVFSFQELLFYKAEAYARGLGVTQDLTMANTLYKQAVEESALYFGVSGSATTTFINSLPDLSTYPKPVDQINLQHWIDKFDRGVDAFTQWRRSGAEGSEVPALELPVGAPSGGLFRRFQYPESGELSSNPNAPELIPFTEKVWFDL